ncbi:MAG: MarR family winged helix-turn-helix transcriptional regulator [Spirochaetia bacterium]|jgi:DNA-binding MarR family transcriptional regulator
MKKRLVDTIIELKSLCHIEDTIGEEFRLTPREVNLMCTLPMEGSLCTGKIADLAGLSPSRTSRLVFSLMKKGYLDYSQDQKDRRYLQIRLSARGSKCRDRLEAEKNDCEQKLVSFLSQQQADKVKESLGLLLTVFQEEM